jgi:hypothetical protein
LLALSEPVLLHLPAVLVLRLLELLDAHVMRLLHPLRADLASLRLLIGMHLTLVLRLHTIAVHLLASRHAVLRVGIAVLVLEGLRLHAALTMLPLGLHLDALRMLLLSLHGKALRAHSMSATAAASEHLRLAAAVVSTTATARKHLGVAAAATAPASEGLGVSATTAATAVLLSLLVALAAAMRPRTSRGCDRERGDAGCEKHPGHDKISFRTAKTARSLHRSNR